MKSHEGGYLSPLQEGITRDSTISEIPTQDIKGLHNALITETGLLWI